MCPNYFRGVEVAFIFVMLMIIGILLEKWIHNHKSGVVIILYYLCCEEPFIKSSDIRGSKPAKPAW